MMKKFDNFTPPPKLSRNYSSSDINSLSAEKPLLGVSLRLPGPCDLKCTYCYADKEREGVDHTVVKKFVKEANGLGAQSVSIVGDGEPLLYKSTAADGSTARLMDLIDYFESLNMQTILYSNCASLTEETALLFKERNVSIVAKENGHSKEVQEKLTGPGSFEKIQRGLSLLKKLGFNDPQNPRLSCHTILTADNAREIIPLWRKWRSENILPQVQICVDNEHDMAKIVPVSVKETESLFKELSRIDREEYGYHWEPYPPIAPHGCKVFYTSCSMRPSGEVTICAYTDVVLGKYPEDSIMTIINRPLTQKIRNIDKHLTGKCFECNLESKARCYGCRAHELMLSGDVFASYSKCWKV